MKILLFGATGRVGSSVLSKLLDKGHTVLVFVRNKKKLGVVHEKVLVLEGDVHDADALDKLKPNSFDAVINAIGADPLKPSSLFTETTSLILSLISDRPQVHYIAITGIAQMPQTFFGKMVIWILKKTPVKNAIRDHQNAFDLVKKSSAHYTLIGCPYIVDGEEKGYYHTSNTFKGGFKTIHPGDVAGGLVSMVGNIPTNKIIGIWY